MTAHAAEWRTCCLRDIADIKTGPFGSALHQADYQPVGTPIVTVEHLSEHGLTHQSLPRVNAADARRLGAYACRPGDILFSRVGSIDRNSLVKKSEDGWLFSGRLLRLRVDPNRVHAPFLGYAFSTVRFKESVRAVAVGQTMPSLNTQILGGVEIYLPDLATQRKIARSLTDIDELISTLTWLTAKKQAIKRGIMQELLTGRTRLPGFSEPRITTTLGALGAILKGRNVRRSDVRSAGVRCVRYGELYSAFDGYTSEVRSFVSRDVAETACALKSGDLLFAGSGETREEIGKCVAYTGPTPAVAGGDVIVLRGDQFNPIYLALLVNMPEVVRQKARAGQGDAVVHIYGRSLAAIEVDLPPREEQDAIASVIVDSDCEIKILSERLRKTQDVKQGMMQELLSGRTRLPESGVAV